jgi:CRP/FNR family nitrogen fixation transcriptional regulator
MPTSLAFHADNGFAAAQAATAFLSRTSAPADRFEPHSAPRSSTIMPFIAGSEIYAEGDQAVSFYKVVSGVVRSCKFLSDGRRQIDAFYVAGDVFGFEAGLQHGLSAEAVNDCKIISFSRRSLEAGVAKDAGTAQEMFSYVMRSLERSRAHSLLLGRGNAAQKLASFLLEMTSRAPADEVIDLVMTRQDIADYLGLTMETVSRTLSQFERDGVIALSLARRVHLKNRTALRNLDS